MIQKTIILFCTIGLFSIHSLKAQDTTIQLISKMDYLPNYYMWDGYQTLLMGYTETLSAPIGLPSPTIIVNEGDSVELKLRNMSQPAAHTIHLHGLDVDQLNDGVPHLSFIVSHGENKSYYFKAPHPGTYLYHCHVFSTLHVQAGMYGMLIVKPSDGSNTTWDGGYTYNRDYSWLSSEIDSVWHEVLTINHPYDSAQTSFAIPDYHPQYFLINGKSEHQLADPTIQIDADANEVLFLRLANIGFYKNSYIFPSELNASIVSSDGRPLPIPEDSDTISVYPGERFGVLLSPTTLFNDSIQIQYSNLNTHQIENIQKVAVNVEGYLNTPKSYSNDNFSVYPNPSNSDFNILLNLKENTNKEISIFDLNGKIIYQLNTKENFINISNTNFDKGLYILNIKTNKNYFTKKIIIQ